MNRLSNIIFLFLILSLTISCSSGNSEEKGNDTATVSEPSADPVIKEDTRLLLKDLDENGDYVNSRNFPSLIKASSVRDAIGTDIHIIDIRKATDFSMGHLPEAINISFDALPEYLMTGIKPFEFEKIIIVSNDGQLASYTTSLLRLMGYGNVYALRWGMSGWNPLFADSGWLKGCSSDYQSNLETKINSKSDVRGMPDLSTALLSGEEISNHRFDLMFKAGLDEVMIDASTVFAKPADYYIINYDRRDKYESGHIPGAVRYKPGATLSMVNEMSTIPVDKTIVVYCGTGHNSGFVTAYLRLFGYDARTLRYGNNGFMYQKMMDDRATLSWLPFTSVDINDYDYVK